MNLWLGHLRSSMFSSDVKAQVILDLNFRPYTTPVNPSSVPSPGNEDGCATYSGPIRVSPVEIQNLSSMKQGGKNE